ncbi:hypothetical protein P9B03_15200 [Metasolibacillus meyeri]|uniref:Uncharacterized protein n=1 Tax=Metasolibacillus meyeri TaxID=1071052 RepID=A0AAW9NY76_9BACL|nr:hypothetical protein [Metasolibacillus meyeri]MEC1179845.1 hypothetical protein [Metasolibacillus meyeri]
MPKPSRQKKSKAKREKQRKERLAIFRYAADLFRALDTVYRFFRMML